MSDQRAGMGACVVMFKPMLAADYEEASLRFPYYASPKLDGIRCLVVDGKARTRSMKPFPNDYVDGFFRTNAKFLANLDGELIVGSPTAKDCFAQTTSGLMSIGGRPNFLFFVFDLIDYSGTIRWIDRAKEAKARLNGCKLKNVGWLLNEKVTSLPALRAFESGILREGYEGVVLRHPHSYYKQGRATLREGSLMKVKRYRDAEAIVVGVDEQMHNGNVAFRNELGRTKRSHAAAGLSGKATLGSLLVKGDRGQPFAGITFGIGTGFDDHLRQTLWQARETLPGTVVKYRYFDIGVKDAPRQPVFLGFRKRGT